MELADILDEDCVLICTGIKSKRDVLTKLANAVAHKTGEKAEDIFEALDDRESLGSTGLGNGIAIPHGKFAPLKRVLAVFMKLDVAVDFESVDDQPVDLVVMLLAPMGAGADHLKALAKVARVLRTESVLDALRRTDDAQKIHAILTQPQASSKAA
jgi:PTS system nitrogen regulatory IIA component